LAAILDANRFETGTGGGGGGGGGITDQTRAPDTGKEANIISDFSLTKLAPKTIILSLAEWLERLTVNAEVATGFEPSILLHSGIWGAADGAVLNTVHKKYKKFPLFHEKSIKKQHM
jgi:hypothetical protein